MRERLQTYEAWLVARFLNGVRVGVLAAAIGVTEEAVRKRLRALGLFNSNGKRGRPKQLSQVCTQQSHH